jgi:methyl-accepting chemotaxis protein
VKAIGEIRQVASSNAKSTEEVSRAIREQAVVTASINSASQELTTVAVELQNVVSRFKLE